MGINHSKGKFIAFIDGDDLWDKNKLELQIDYMKNKNYQITHTAYHIIDEDDKVTGLRKSKNLDYNNLINSGDVGLSTVILNKELLNIDISFPNFKTKEDYFLWLKLSKENYIFNYIDEPLSNWRKTKFTLKLNNSKIADSFRVYYHYEKNFIITIYRILIPIINFIKKVLMEIELNKIILLLLLSSLIYYFSQKFKKFSNISIEPHQKFSSDELAVPIGGSIIFLFIFFLIFTLVLLNNYFCF